MHHSRPSFAYVVALDGVQVTLNLKEQHRGLVSSHQEGVSAVLDVGSVFGVQSGSQIVVLKTIALSFAEPKEVHRWTDAHDTATSQPLRHLIARPIGILHRTSGVTAFSSDSGLAPPLGAEAFPLTSTESRTVYSFDAAHANSVLLGQSVRGFGPVYADFRQLLSRHVAVLGSTGQGKSCFTAAVLQQLIAMPSPRIVIFDINGEYTQALAGHAGSMFKKTIIGGPSTQERPSFRIPYFSLGRNGISRLLLPSERTQRPALNFALENLCRVQSFPDEDGIGLSDDDSAVMFDDCRPGDADLAADRIRQLRNGQASSASVWPSMKALSCLIAESHSLKLQQNRFIRDAFAYGNVSQLITRIWRYCEDPSFCSVVDTQGGKPTTEGVLDWKRESQNLVDHIFGADNDTWKVHIVELCNVAHDLMPMILGSLLELFAFQLFQKGPENNYPTLLVLEEAHHYLRAISEEKDDSASALAYERLAKEGRKFGVSLWLSTQRPSEVSQTVLSQCGTWAAFRLSGEPDLRAIAAAAEWVDRGEMNSISGLPRQHALIFGAAVTTPVRIKAPTAEPGTHSRDPAFARWLEQRQSDSTTNQQPVRRIVKKAAKKMFKRPQVSSEEE